MAEGGESAGAHGHPLAEPADPKVGTGATILRDVAMHFGGHRDLYLTVHNVGAVVIILAKDYEAVLQAKYPERPCPDVDVHIIQASRCLTDVG